MKFRLIGQGSPALLGSQGLNSRCWITVAHLLALSLHLTSLVIVAVKDLMLLFLVPVSYTTVAHISLGQLLLSGFSPW